jgi:Ca2+/Na+ antiporter
LTLDDQASHGGGSQIGTIVGVVIGLLVIIGAIVIGLIFLKKRQKMPEGSDTPSSDREIQFARDTLTMTTDETPVSYHESFTYEGGPSLVTPVTPPSLLGNDRSITTLPLI